MSTRRKPILLVIHDDNVVLRHLAKMTSELAELVVTCAAGRAMAILGSDQEIDAVLVGKAGDGVPAMEMLRAVFEKRPQVRSILLADAGDLSTSIEALHGGVVDHVMNPPLRERELLAILAMPTPRPLMPAVAMNVGAAALRPA